MKIYCDYCGTQIDTDTDPSCPSCGAPYVNDEEFKAEQTAERKRQENKILLGDFDRKIAELRAQEMLKETEHMRRERELRSKGKFIVAALSFALVIYVIIKIGAVLPKPAFISFDNTISAAADTI